MGKNKFFNVKVDDGQLSRIFADLPKALQVATVAAVNTTARKVNKDLKQHVSSEYNVPKSDLRVGDLIKIRRGNVKTQKPRAVIAIRRKGRDIIEYNPLQVKSGLVVAIQKNKAIKIPKAFTGIWHKGDTHFHGMIKATGRRAGKVQRVSAAGKAYMADKRQTYYGSPIAKLYTNIKTEPVISKAIDETFQTALDKEFNKQFEKR